MQLKGNVFLKIKRRSMNNMITPKEIEQKTMSLRSGNLQKMIILHSILAGHSLMYSPSHFCILIFHLMRCHIFRLCLQLLGLYCWQWEKMNLHYLGDGSLFSCGACWTELMEI